MATSYKKKSAKSKNRTKGGVEQAVKAADVNDTIFGSAPLDQDPPIIIKPGGSLFVRVQNTDIGGTPTRNTLGNPKPDPPRGGIHVRYDHNETTHKVDRVTLLHVPTNVEVATWNLADWSDYAILLYYHK